MPSLMITLGIDQLSVDDRLKLIGEIWDSLSETPEAIPLTDAQKQALDHRIAAFETDPEVGTSLEQVEAELLNRQ